MGLCKMKHSTRPCPTSAWLLILISWIIAAPSFGAGFAAVGASPNSVTLNWTAPGDDGSTGTATQYDVRYSLSPITEANWDAATQAVGEPTPHAAGSAETFEVTGLLPSTTYYFAIKTADEVPNWSAMSNVISKATDAEETPPAIISNLAAGSPGQTSIGLSWTAPGDDGSTGTASEYDIRYSTSTITDANWDAATQVSGEPSPQSAGSSESFTVTNLSPSTTYYFGIKTADEVPNWSGLSNIASATTQSVPTVPDPPILATPSNGATNQSQPIFFDWADISGVDQYQLQVAVNSGFGAPTVDTNLTLSGCNVSGLDDDQLYYWRVRAHNSVGWSNWSTIWSLTTSCPVPLVPILATPNNGANGLEIPVELDWSDVSNTTGYSVQVDDNYNFSSPVINTSVAVSNYSASSLDDQTTYYWRVRAVNDCGSGSWSSIRSFTTSDTTSPQAISGLAAVPGDNDDEAFLSWTATGDDGNIGTADLYDIRYSTSTITEANWNSVSQVSGEPSPHIAGTPETFTVSGLNTNTQYYFAIKVRDEAGNWSGISNVATTTPADNMPPAAIQDLSAETGSSDGTVHLSWTAPGDDGTDGTVSAYVIRYSQEQLTEANWNSATIYDKFVPPLTAGQTQTTIIEGLDAAETYYFAVKSSDDALNFSEISNNASCKAGAGFPTDIDEGQVVAAGPDAGSEVHSSHPSLFVNNIGLSPNNLYYFEVATDSNFADLAATSTPVTQQEGDLTTWQVDERLDAGQTYFWRARANSSVYSTVSYFTVMPTTHAYPNPFRLAEANEVTFTEIPSGANFYLMSVSGTMVREWNNVDGDIVWDGTNQSGQPVASGTYLWMVENSDAKGKLVVIR
jgi:trimeric autotransporter adhesin